MTDEQPKPQAELLDRLSDAVERLLRQGATFEEIKINDLVREGGLAKSTFYVYFADKTALLSALAQRVMSDLVGFDAAWWHLPPSASKHEIALALSAMFEDYRAHGLLLDAITAATVYDQALRTQFGALMGVAVEATAEFLRTSQAAGLTPAELDPTYIAFSLVWMLERGFNRLLVRSTPQELRTRLASLTEIIWWTVRGHE
ncbi:MULTISPECIES: TetR/AcrR family transcriptional regulator [Mycobacterium]|uniref:TetR/AcrR family transcriptional regulator n=1 Tax=Mycobacterium TaxID=1763 RepID=UPI001EF11A28|nr:MULTISPECIES: TetR/AcrR family transcriptional regulator [Mycobacterium]